MTIKISYFENFLRIHLAPAPLIYSLLPTTFLMPSAAM
jgi:hypothetical protein